MSVRRFAWVWAFAVAVAATGVPARAATTPATAAAAATAGSATAAPVEAALEFVLNGADSGKILFVLQEAGQIWLRERDFATLRLRVPSSAPRIESGERYHLLDARNGLDYEFNVASQRVTVRATPTAFLGTQLTVGRRDSVPQTAAAPGGFVNYQFFGQRGDESLAGGFAELGLFSRLGVLTATSLGRHEAGTTRAVRLDTTLTRDFPDRLATLSLGDSISDGGSYGDSVRFGGLRIGRNFAQRPDLLTMPLLSANGSATVPSTVDVFVNGQLMSRQRVGPGPFVIDRVPAMSGGGEISLVVRDALGRETVSTQAFYSSPTLLARGLSEYAIDLGQLREDYLSASNRYGATMGQATWRRGLSDAVTVELRGEYLEPGLGNVGGGATFALARLGTLSATAARGGDSLGRGALTGLAFERRGARFSVLASRERRDAGYRQVGDAEAPSLRLRSRDLAQLGLTLGRAGSVSIAWARQETAARVVSEVASLTHNLRLGEWGAVTAILSRSFGTEGSNAGFLVYTRPLGERRSLSLSAATDSASERAAEAVAAFAQNGGPGPGIDYRAVAAASGDYDRRWRRRAAAPELEQQAARDRGGTLQSAWLGGAATFLDGDWRASRSVSGSFAVVEVAGLAGVPVYLENQLVAHTDARGRALLADLRAYEPNRIGIDPTDLPLDVSIEAPELTIAPPWRSGVIARLAVARIRGGTFRLLQDDRTPVPAGAIVEFNGVRFPVAMDGFVYVTNFDHGLSATASWPGGRCRFRIEPPPAHDPQPDMGTLGCHGLRLPDMQVRNASAAEHAP